MNRIDRLTAILIQLQTKRVVKAEEIASRFETSLRTVYRDIKSLMEAGVPIGSEAGKGYFIVDGYHLPPVMFTRGEASALLFGGKLVEKMTDYSVRQEFQSALFKVQSVLDEQEKDHLEVLQSKVMVWNGLSVHQENPPTCLAQIQQAVVQRKVLTIDYISSYGEVSKREVEPVGLYYYGAAWHLIAFCLLRKAYRDFRVDRIKSITITNKDVDEPNLMSLQEYVSSFLQNNREMLQVTVLFQKKAARHVGSAKYTHGFLSEEEGEDCIRMTFLTCYIDGLARWLLMFGNMIDVESPEVMKDKVVELVEELIEHHKVFEGKAR